MSTGDNIDTIMRELIALDPTFKEKEGEVRMLISLLREKKPVVTINETFVRDLRARLTVPHQFPRRTPYHGVNWWAVHLAPIGALAILLLILMPDGLHYLEDQNTVPAESPASESFQMNVADDASLTEMAPSAKFAPEPEEESSDNVRTFGVMGQGGNMVPPPDYFILSIQNPGVSVIVQSVTLTRPGYVVIHTFGPQGIGPVVGISPLQNGGTTVGVPIYLRNATRRGEQYYAALYHDNGNGVFSLSDDIPVIDEALGVPLSTRFTIGVSEVE